MASLQWMTPSILGETPFAGKQRLPFCRLFFSGWNCDTQAYSTHNAFHFTNETKYFWYEYDPGDMSWTCLGMAATCITWQLEILHVFATPISATALVGRKWEEGVNIDIDANVDVDVNIGGNGDMRLTHSLKWTLVWFTVNLLKIQ